MTCIIFVMSEAQVTSAGRLIAVLDALSAHASGSSAGMTVGELARAVDRDHSVISRQLKSLVELGLVDKDEQNLHRLGWRLYALAARAGDQRLLQVAPRVMRTLATRLNERVHLSLRRNGSVLTIMTEGSEHTLQAASWVGRLAPIVTSSSGRALLFDHSPEELADLFDSTPAVAGGPNASRTAEEFVRRVLAARDAGYAQVVDEFEHGLSAVAAPIRDGAGRIVAAINVSAPSFRLEGRMDEAVQQILAATKYLGKALEAPPS